MLQKISEGHLNPRLQSRYQDILMRESRQPTIQAGKRSVLGVPAQVVTSAPREVLKAIQCLLPLECIVARRRSDGGVCCTMKQSPSTQRVTTITCCGLSTSRNQLSSRPAFLPVTMPKSRSQASLGLRTRVIGNLLPILLRQHPIPLSQSTSHGCPNFL